MAWLENSTVPGAPAIALALIHHAYPWKRAIATTAAATAAHVRPACRAADAGRDRSLRPRSSGSSRGSAAPRAPAGGNPVRRSIHAQNRTRNAIASSVTTTSRTRSRARARHIAAAIKPNSKIHPIQYASCGSGTFSKPKVPSESRNTPGSWSTPSRRFRNSGEIPNSPRAIPAKWRHTSARKTATASVQAVRSRASPPAPQLLNAVVVQAAGRLAAGRRPRTRARSGRTGSPRTRPPRAP